MIPASLVDAVQLALRERGVVRQPIDLRELARVAVEAALESGEVVLARCLCPVGWGQDHGMRSPAHVVAMGYRRVAIPAEAFDRSGDAKAITFPAVSSRLPECKRCGRQIHGPTGPDGRLREDVRCVCGAKPPADAVVTEMRIGYPCSDELEEADDDTER